MVKKEMIAMLLAGGQGSRLGVFTSKVAKPAVAFGGKYRIIDFPLSNCINSGVDTVGVLTQYQPLRLNTHIGIGIPWDLDRNIGGVTVLPPYEKSVNSEWYTGTANAIYQNLDYMESYNPEYVLILSGDTASAALNPQQKESYELFSDGAAACVLTKAEKGEASAVLYGCQKTWSEGAHDTEIRGGCGLMPSFCMDEANREDYYFDMKGPRILKLCARRLPDFLNQCLFEADIHREEIRKVVPHQASRALDIIMPRLGFGEGTYMNRVWAYGNMVSASVPYALCEAIQEGKVQRGDLILLMGTAAGLTVNFMLLRY